jgi:capsular exopolysaccharide synthesis family protein
MATKKKSKTLSVLPGATTNMLLSDDAPFSIQEAYKAARTNLLFSMASGDSNAVVLSSAEPSEGKSTTCSNMAIAMAQTGAKVLLIDADLRKPVQHRIFRIPNQKGLSGLLGGFYPLSQAVAEGQKPNLDILPSGSIPPNPSELLGSTNMSELLLNMSEVYDYIFLDSPPVNVVTDAVVLANRTAGVLLVTRQGQSTYDSLARAVESIEFSRAKILGLLINAAGERRGRFGAYKRSGYKYKYEYAAVEQQ